MNSNLFIQKKILFVFVITFLLKVSIYAQTATNWSTLSGGDYSIFAIKSDGTLWAWGRNLDGNLGDGTTIDRNSPIQVGNSNNWATVSASQLHTLAIKSDGTLWAWGSNGFNQLGDGTNIQRNNPIQIGTDNNWSSVYAGAWYSIGLKSDGTLWGWGKNEHYELGDGTNIQRNIPVQIGNSNNWVKISAGADHNMGIQSDGSLWGWGQNSQGKIGDGTNISRSMPIQIQQNSTWSKVSAGRLHTLAIKSDGTLWSWGYNSFGQLGDGTTIDRASPIQVGTSTDWHEISSGAYHSLAIKSDGTLWNWGSNAIGQLGDGTIIDKKTPTLNNSQFNVIQIEAGYGYSQIIKIDRQQICNTGSNAYGLLGIGTNVNHSYVYTCQINAGTNQITLSNLATSICSGLVFPVSYSINELFNPGNIFTAQLSNSAGSFTNPTVIGNLTGTSNGTINATIPIPTPAGSGYRIRVVSSSPIVIGTDNGSNITISTATQYFVDADGDGYGNSAVSIFACSTPVGYISNNADCNDSNNAIHPGASEICNEVDDDCDGIIDEGVQVTANCIINKPIIYYGYSGDQTATFKVTPSGGVAPYNVSITMNRLLNCNVVNSTGDETWTGIGGTTINNICPTTDTGSIPISSITGLNSGEFYSVYVSLMQNAILTATITDANGCTFICSKTINAEDVRCFAGNSGNSKVRLCHQTGSITNPCIEICVNESSVEAHLDHGDFIGNCTSNCIAPVYNTSTSLSQIQEENQATEFNVRAIPNPTENQFTLILEGITSEKVLVIIYDMLGRKIYQLENNAVQTIKFGDDLKAGIYVADVRQGENRKIIKLVKQ